MRYFSATITHLQSRIQYRVIIAIGEGRIPMSISDRIWAKFADNTAFCRTEQNYRGYKISQTSLISQSDIGSVYYIHRDSNRHELETWGLREPSEEICADCGRIFDMYHAYENCPSCGKLVLACNACDAINCSHCRNGCNWNARRRISPTDLPDGVKLVTLEEIGGRT